VILVVKRFVRKGVPAEHRPMVRYFMMNIYQTLDGDFSVCCLNH